MLSIPAFWDKTRNPRGGKTNSGIKNEIKLNYNTNFILQFIHYFYPFMNILRKTPLFISISKRKN